ncbi:hypothetical protein CP533_4874 [Ophiocordyceps camponoti-saundersi (nom. inval.)]|nr:hypothetical protein CP533_4874 [Ophiocordyceps camponoti-saundersi (nom. inval.)]
MSSTARLLQSKHFTTLSTHGLNNAEKIRLAYLRAREIARHFGFTTSDIKNLTQKFWDFHRNDICALDLAAFSLLTIQYNLMGGTLLRYIDDRPEHQPLLEKVFNFDVSAQFMLTELGHGLDAKSLETTATYLPGEGFDLHTPHLQAAKYMPPTSPIEGFPRVGLVFAKLIVKGEEHGVRPFIVWLNDGINMTPGISCRVLPTRAASKPLDHSITIFNHVRLPSSAILGSLDKAENERKSFLQVISRLEIGAMAISTTFIPVMKRCVYTAGKYSMRREIRDHQGRARPIFYFRTQHEPVCHALSQLLVFEAWVPDNIRRFMDPMVESGVRLAMPALTKALLTKTTQTSLWIFAERCGAQGLYECNDIIESQNESRGLSISEGDALMLSIRLAIDLLLDRYRMPPAEYPESLLAKHESSLLQDLQDQLQKLGNDHRSNDFNATILPRCLPLVEAIGHRMAYESGKKAGVVTEVLSLFEIGAVLQDPAWYVENCGLSRAQQLDMESRAVGALVPMVDGMLDSLGVEPFCRAPILSDGGMESFVGLLETFDQRGLVRDSQATPLKHKL